MGHFCGLVGCIEDLRRFIGILIYFMTWKQEIANLWIFKWRGWKPNPSPLAPQVKNLTTQPPLGIFVVWPAWKSNFVADVVILLPVKFHWILLGCFRGKIKNVSASQRPGRQSCFLIGPKTTNWVEEVEILLPIKFRWIMFSFCREDVENVKS